MAVEHPYSLIMRWQVQATCLLAIDDQDHSCGLIPGCHCGVVGSFSVQVLQHRHGLMVMDRKTWETCGPSLKAGSDVRDFSRTKHPLICLKQKIRSLESCKSSQKLAWNAYVVDVFVRFCAGVIALRKKEFVGDLLPKRANMVVYVLSAGVGKCLKWTSPPKNRLYICIDRFEESQTNTWKWYSTYPSGTLFWSSLCCNLRSFNAIDIWTWVEVAEPSIMRVVSKTWGGFMSLLTHVDAMSQLSSNIISLINSTFVSMIWKVAH